MKLYTKKMTYSLLAIGLLAGSPVDAKKKKHKGVKVAAGVVGGTAALGGAAAGGAALTGVTVGTAFGMTAGAGAAAGVAAAGTAAGTAITGAATGLGTAVGASAGTAAAVGAGIAAGGAALVGAVGAGVARGAEFANCKRMCRGYFVDDANKKKLTGAIKKGDIKVDLKGVGKKRTCHCEYKGDLGIDKKQEFKQIEARKSKTQKNLKKVSKHADSKKCDQSKEMCLVKK